MSQSSDTDKSLNDKIEEGLSSFIGKTKEVTGNLVEQAKDVSSGLVDNIKSIIPTGSDEESPGYNAPNTNINTNPTPIPNTNTNVDKEITALENPTEDINAAGGEDEPELEEKEEEPNEEVVLELGDVIYIIDPSSEILNDNTLIKFNCKNNHFNQKEFKLFKTRNCAECSGKKTNTFEKLNNELIPEKLFDKLASPELLRKIPEAGYIVEKLLPSKGEYKDEIDIRNAFFQSLSEAVIYA